MAGDGGGLVAGAEQVASDMTRLTEIGMLSARRWPVSHSTIRSAISCPWLRGLASGWSGSVFSPVPIIVSAVFLSAA